MGGLIQFGQGGGDDHGDGVTAMYAEAAGCDRGLEAELQGVVAALAGAAVVPRCGAGVGLVTTGPDRGLDGLEVSARLRIKEPGQP